MVEADEPLSWRKSTRSGEAAHCVEVAIGDQLVAVRDSKDPAGPMLTFARQDWRGFVAGVRAGDFDRL